MHRLRIVDTGGYRKVVATEAIPRASLRIDMRHGETIPIAEMRDDYYAFQISADLFLGSRTADERDLTCFLNHGCDPNLAFDQGEAILINLRDIAVGEELCWDYSTSIDDGVFAMDCRCGSPLCRGRVVAFSALAPAEQARLLPLALAYIQQRSGAAAAGPAP